MSNDSILYALSVMLVVGFALMATERFKAALAMFGATALAALVWVVTLYRG